MLRSRVLPVIAALAALVAFSQTVHAGGKPRTVKMLRPPTTRPAPETTPRLRGNPIGDPLSIYYDRANRTFRRAAFWKPAPDTATEQDRQMGPWLVQELPERGDPLPATVRMGSVETDPSGSLTVDTSRPTVYMARGTTKLGEAYCDQYAHIWATPGPDGRGVQWHGVRTTYGPRGWPVAWEVLKTGSEPAVLYVSQPLEDAAQRQYGRPLSGRRNAAERSRSEQPDVVVARVLPEGKDPAGPVVYMDAGAQAVTTLLCRCMQPQAQEFGPSVGYELLPLEIIGDVHVPADGPFRIEKGPPTPSTTVTGQASWLEQALRIPRRF